MLLILKLGGAAITDKSCHRIAKPDAIAALARTIATWLRRSGSTEHQVIIVHGAGSFGHFEAKQYGLNDASSDGHDPSRMLGLCLCKASLAELHALVLRSLVDAGVPAVTVPLFPDASDLYPRCVRLLSHGMIPVLHGDPVLHGANSSRVVGGDAVALQLIQQHVRAATATGKSPTARVVFITGVEGVFTGPPGVDPAAQLIRVIRVLEGGGCSYWVRGDDAASLKEVSVAAVALSATSGAADVTGGIAAKARAALDIVAACSSGDCSCHIVGVGDVAAAHSSDTATALETLLPLLDSVDTIAEHVTSVTGTHVMRVRESVAVRI